MGLEDLYRQIYPEMFNGSGPVAASGQVFVRDVGNGLSMVCGIIPTVPGLPDERLCPAELKIDAAAAVDVSDRTHGQSISGVLKLPIWSVRAAESSNARP